MSNLCNTENKQRIEVDNTTFKEPLWQLYTSITFFRRTLGSDNHDTQLFYENRINRVPHFAFMANGQILTRRHFNIIIKI
jgi:hypothetical protein